MKVIYMEQTLQLIAKTHGSEVVSEIIKSGEVKQNEIGNYLIITK